MKKAYALYPGIARPISAPILADHYRQRRAQRGPIRAALDAGIGLGFLAWVGWRARQVQRKFGLSPSWRRQAIAIARAHFVDPNDIALFRIGEAAELDHYIRRFEDAALNKIINPLGWSKTCALADKGRFYARCRAVGLPHPETVAIVAGGKVQLMADPAGRELIAKPADGEGGDGVQVLGSIAHPAELTARLGALPSDASKIIVQPRIATHPALTDLALDALPTVRIVTLLDETGVPEVVSATLRFASVTGVSVDNMKAGGLIAAVDLATGVLGIASKGYGGGDYPTHPVTGAAITGRALPDWPRAKALAILAHQTGFPDYALIGWDVALTPDCPILIEGNGKPGVLMPQRAARVGLAQGRYGVLLAHNLAIKS